jgi:hypothetical protein
MSEEKNKIKIKLASDVAEIDKLLDLMIIIKSRLMQCQKRFGIQGVKRVVLARRLKKIASSLEKIQWEQNILIKELNIQDILDERKH